MGDLDSTLLELFVVDHRRGEPTVSRASVAGNLADLDVAEGAVEVVGDVASARIENEQRAADLPGHLFDSLHQRSTNPLAPSPWIDEHLGDLGAMTSVRLRGQVQLRGSDDPTVALGDQQGRARPGDTLPIALGVDARERRQEADRGALGDDGDQQIG